MKSTIDDLKPKKIQLRIHLGLKHDVN